MADAKSSLSSAAHVIAPGVAGAALGHFAGKGKNILLGAALLLGADMIAEHLPIKAVNASHIRTAGALCMLVTPSAASANQSVSDFAKQGLNRVKGYGNALVQGTGVTKGPFALTSPSLTALPVEGYDYVGETPYDDPYMLDTTQYYPQAVGELMSGEVLTAGR